MNGTRETQRRVVRGAAGSARQGVERQSTSSVATAHRDRAIESGSVFSEAADAVVARSQNFAIMELKRLVAVEELLRAEATGARSPARPGAERSPRHRRFASMAMNLAFLTAVSIFVGLAIFRLFGFSIVVVNGGSMGAAAPSGSLALTRPVAKEHIGVGDIVVVQHEASRTPVLHRVDSIERDGDALTVSTKGDANATADPWPSVLGRTVQKPFAVVPWLGYLIGAARTPVGWVALVVIPAIWLCASILRRIWAAPSSHKQVNVGSTAA
jgi:signal peptidase I